MKTKKIPMRMCTGCMEMKPKKDLIRVVRSNEGEISIDMKGKKPGRGAYVCRDEACLKLSFKTKRLSKNLEADISEEIFAALNEAIKGE
ncbi:MAG: YlxR family protein [Youngiibacter sp.]|jgi:hypothetical protein|nr:YlxR family protein [Youngiibacter sp.]